MSTKSTITFVALSLMVWTLAACASSTGARPPAILDTTSSVGVADGSEQSALVAEAEPAEATTVPADEDSVAALPTVTVQPVVEPAPIFDPATTQIALEAVADGFDRPLFVTHAGDASDRLFVVERGGRIHILQDDVRLPEPFLDITDRVNDGSSEQGLLGLAFDPDYADNGYFFVNYTDAQGATIVARFQVAPDNPNLADPADEFEVLRVEQPARNHNGGMLTFGPDGYLYIGLGDGGGGGDQYEKGQNPASLLGKMLRVDVTSNRDVPYVIPADNPWVDQDWQGADVLDEIWAVGLRNPWRYSFDRATGALWLSDVGQGKFEEVNRINAVADAAPNFGWPIMEGTHCFPDDDTCSQDGLTLPVTEYDHSGGNCSVTGGYVYRGAEFPELAGVYFFSDYCSGDIWALQQNGDGTWQQHTMLENAGRVASFGEDEAGELYVTDIGGGTVTKLIVVADE